MVTEPLSVKLAFLKDKLNNPVDPNLVQTKRSKIELQARILKGVSLPRHKDKYGNNVKEHIGLWKYFIDTKTMQRDKFYINMQGQRMIGREAQSLCKKEEDKEYRREAFRQIRSVGLKGYNRNDIEFWGIPKGVTQ